LFRCSEPVVGSGVECSGSVGVVLDCADSTLEAAIASLAVRLALRQ